MILWPDRLVQFNMIVVRSPGCWDISQGYMRTTSFYNISVGRSGTENEIARIKQHWDWVHRGPATLTWSIWLSVHPQAVWESICTSQRHGTDIGHVHDCSSDLHRGRWSNSTYYLIIPHIFTPRNIGCPPCPYWSHHCAGAEIMSCWFCVISYVDARGESWVYLC